MRTFDPTVPWRRIEVKSSDVSLIGVSEHEKKLFVIAALILFWVLYTCGGMKPKQVGSGGQNTDTHLPRSFDP